MGIKIKKNISLGLAIVFLFATFSQAIPVQADGAPPPGALGSDLYPNLDATKVRMEAETVLITIPENSDYYGYSIVTATFYMRNMGEETEQMKARFPMNLSDYNMLYEMETGKDSCGPSMFPSLENLSVKINDQDTNFVTTTLSWNWYDNGKKEDDILYNCWAYFDVVFPPGEQVVIQVQYKVSGYKGEFRIVEYKYIMQTGQGWYGTIGTADILVKLPYEVNLTNLEYCRPQGCSLNENMISWHFDDFEPQENIDIQIIDPSIWSRIVRESANVEKDPEDWEAWGRLGKAYKDAIIERHGMVLKDEYPEFYRISIEAYQKAIEHLPNDADWHWGYAELLCRDSKIFIGNPFTTDDDIAIEDECVAELKTALQLNPSQKEAHEFLLSLYQYAPEFYAKHHLEEAGALLSLPTYTPSPFFAALTRTHAPTITPSPTMLPSMVLYVMDTPTQTLTPAPTLPPTATPEQTAENHNSEQKGLFFSIFSNILLLVLFVLAYQRKGKP